MLPIVSRELIEASRRTATYRTRWVAGLLGLATMLWLFVVQAAASPGGSQGRALFLALSSLAFAQAVLVGAFATADSVSGEKRDGTLGLLFLTPLRSWQILIGKLSAAAIKVVFGLLSMVPVISVGVLLGGVTGTQLALVCASLLNVLFLTLCAGLLVSTVSRNEREAMFGTLGLVVFWILAPYVIAIGVSIGSGAAGRPAGLQEYFVMWSPLYSFVFAQGGVALRMTTQATLALSFVFVHLTGWLMLVLASGLLPRMALERRSSSKNAASPQSLQQRLVYGRAEGRRRHRHRMLERGAFAWLAGRDRCKPWLVWFFLGSLAVIFLLTEWMSGAPFVLLDWQVGVWMAFFVQGFLKVWVAAEVCSRLAEDRRAGALELLLCTSLSVRDMVRGQSRALRRQFLGPVLAVLAFDLWLWWKMPGNPSALAAGQGRWLLAALTGVFVLDLFAIAWVGRWRALAARRLNHALVETLALVLVLPWLLFAVWLGAYVFLVLSAGFFGINSLLGVPLASGDPEFGVALPVWTAIHALVGAGWWWRIRGKVLREFRSLAAGQFQSAPEAPIKPEAPPGRADTAIKPRAPHRQQWWRRPWLAGSVLLVAIGLAALSIHRAQLRRQIEAEIARVRARGEPLEEDALNPLRGRMVGRSLSDLNRPFPEVVPVPYPAGVRSGKEFALGQPLSETVRDYYLRIINSNRAGLAFFGALTNFATVEPLRRNLHLSLDEARQESTLWLHSQILSRAALLHANEGRVAEASQIVVSILSMGEMFGGDPFVYRRSYRPQAAGISLDALEYLLSRQRLDRTTLDWIDAALARFEARTADTRWIADAVIGSRIALLRWNEEPLAQFGTMTGANPPPLAEFLAGGAKLSGGFDRAWLDGLRTLERFRTLAGIPHPEIITLSERLEATTAPVRPVGFLTTGFAGSIRYSPQLRREADALTRLRAARAALALEKHRLAGGRRVADLSDLIPDYLIGVPSSAADGSPLTLTFTNGGYHLKGTRADLILTGSTGHGPVTFGVERPEE